MNFIWNKPTESGVCDRLCDILYVLAFSRLYKARLHTQWAGYQMRSYDLPHRAFDIKFENILKHFKFPEDLIFDLNINPDLIFSDYVGGGLSPKQFYNKFVDKKFSLEEYLVSVDKASKEFGFCDKIEKYLLGIPKKFVGFHIRRGDKVIEGHPPETGIQPSQLDNLNKITFQAIDDLIQKGHDKFFFCGDEDAATDVFINYAKSKEAECFCYRDKEKWKTTYYDVAILSKSDLIISSQKYSSFSLFASLIGSNNMKSVYEYEAD